MKQLGDGGHKKKRRWATNRNAM